MLPTTSTIGSYVRPVKPMPINTSEVAMIVAMVMPEIGLELEPMIPTILLETVTKKLFKGLTSFTSFSFFTCK